MLRMFGKRYQYVLIIASLLMGLSPASLTLAQVDNPTDDPTQKAGDLQRALARGGVSPDRLVVVYDLATPPGDTVRLNVRRQVGGQLLQADSAVGRDVIRVQGDSADVVAQRVRPLSGVRDAYADPVASVALSVNDPYLRSEWGLATILAPTAWDTSQASGVAGAVLDCGVHGSHPDLAGKVILEQNFSSALTTDDRCNHGTHVAGTIAAVTNNGIGVAAVAPAAKILNGKVLNDNGSGFFSDIDLGIEWAADHGARVINMSLGGATPCPTGTQMAANYAWNKGVILVAAAGNSGASGALAPANCLNVIGVAATDAKDTRAVWSNYGAQVDVAAPGVSIRSTVNPDLNGGSQYAYFSGTSMATPHVSGVAALLWATSFGTGPATVRDRLFTTADHINGTGTSWTYGRINAASALAGAGAPMTPAAPSGLTAQAVPHQIRLNWVASATPSMTYNVYRGTVAGGVGARIATGAAGTSYDDGSALIKGQTYCYTTTAQGGIVESAPSNEACTVARQ
jgi:thermitase